MKVTISCDGRSFPHRAISFEVQSWEIPSAEHVSDLCPLCNLYHHMDMRLERLEDHMNAAIEASETLEEIGEP